MKETVKERAVTQEEIPELFVNGKDTVAVGDIDQFKGHGSSALHGVKISAGRAETAMAAEGNKLELSTVRAAIHGTAIGRVTTMKHLVDVFDNRSARVKFVNHIFIIIIKDRL